MALPFRVSQACSYSIAQLNRIKLSSQIEIQPTDYISYVLPLINFQLSTRLSALCATNQLGTDTSACRR